QRIKGIYEYQQDMADRLERQVGERKPDPNRRETLYGIEQPYSIAKKIAFFGQEKTLRAGQFNADAKDFNAFMKAADQLTSGQYRLFAQYALPENIQPDGQA